MNHKKERSKFNWEIRLAAVAEYIFGRKSAAQLAVELNTTPSVIYRWKMELEDEVRIREMDRIKLQVGASGDGQ